MYNKHATKLKQDRPRPESDICIYCHRVMQSSLRALLRGHIHSQDLHRVKQSSLRALLRGHIHNQDLHLFSNVSQAQFSKFPASVWSTA